MFSIKEIVTRLSTISARFTGAKREYKCKRISGKNNHIHQDKASFSNVSLDISGDFNEVFVGDSSVLNNVKIYIRGNKNRIVIGKNCRFVKGGDLWIEDDGCALNIGDDSSFIDVHLAVTETGSKIDIGSDCMFAYDIDVRTGDSHSILDMDTGKRINQARDVFIDDHVWVASHVNILKGVHIQKGSVVATGSILAKSIDEANVVYAGNPAVVVKRKIEWSRERV